MIENLRSLAILAAVVENGSLKAAGDKLGLSASVVSHHISNLEKRLDCAIFHRTSRKLHLTDRGAVLHSAAREMVDVVNGGLSAISGEEDVVSGTLRIAAPQFLTSNKFQHGLESFLGTYPKVNLEVTMTATINSAQDGGFDVLITRHQNFDKSHMAFRLTELVMSPVAAPDLAAKINQIPLQDVPKKIPLILAPGFSKLDWENAFSNAIGEKTRIDFFRLNSDCLSLAHQIACSGGGVVVQPDHRMSVDLNSGRLVKVLPELSLQKRPLHVVCPRSAVKTSLTRRFVDHILLEYEAGALIEQMQKAG